MSSVLQDNLSTTKSRGLTPRSAVLSLRRSLWRRQLPRGRRLELLCHPLNHQSTIGSTSSWHVVVIPKFVKDILQPLRRTRWGRRICKT